MAVQPPLLLFGLIHSVGPNHGKQGYQPQDYINNLPQVILPCTFFNKTLLSKTLSLEKVQGILMLTPLKNGKVEMVAGTVSGIPHGPEGLSLPDALPLLDPNRF